MEVNALLRKLARLNRLLALCWFAFVLFALPAFAEAQTNVVNLSAADVLRNIAEQVPRLIQMVTAIAYVLGFYFVFVGLLKLKHFGEQRSMHSQEHGLSAPLIYLMVGILLIYLPSSVRVGLSTFFAEPAPYGYLEATGQWDQFYNTVYSIIQFIGIIAFIRGLVLLTHTGGHGQQGTFARALSFIIGGILCINIYQVVQVVFVTLGIQTS
ncbi:MAG: hypothetical protein A3F14_06545 [Gammaproteobacteria bacterium RIFCSPHIGHO2_12_FULL_43_28]|nr:MAG: hypothetical protein A3F14_06545 [Gammaproteobacteria bacterium RIFCSPHIGHO2_12_FULL_43_28]